MRIGLAWSDSSRRSSSHGSFLARICCGDLLDHLRRRDLVRQRGDDDVGAFLHPGRARTHAAVAGFVHRQQVGSGRDDLGGGRIVGTAHVLAQLAHAGIGIVEQAHAGADDLVEVVRRHVGGHADRDAGGAVEQQVRQARRQPGRFLAACRRSSEPSRPCRARVRRAALRRSASAWTRCSASPRTTWDRRWSRNCPGPRSADSGTRTAAPSAPAPRSRRCRRADGTCR